MVRAIDSALAGWERDEAVGLVLIDGAGERGFCAGGDIRALYDAALVGDASVSQAFFRAEYRLNARIARYRKPYVAFMDGIVMGGGIGLSSHGSHRVVTERSRLAMPEVGIGFMPDVGATWLLGRAPGGFGLHAALTGGELGPADAVLCGLADICVASDRLAELAQALAGCGDGDAIRSCLAGFEITPPAGVLGQGRAWMADCYAGERMEDIVEALATHDAPAAREAAAQIGRKSPTSLKVTLRALREAPALGGLEACLEREYRLALALLARPDFREGVRAAVVDKDRKPCWHPALLAEVTPPMVDAILVAPGAGGLGLAIA